MAYAKLFSTITESSLWSASKDARLLFLSMLAKADQVGFVEAALPGLARLANLTMPETEAALAELMAPDPHSKSLDCDGARVVKVERGWCLVNYEAYRDRRDDEQRRGYMRDYMQDYRKKFTHPDATPVAADDNGMCKQPVNTVSSGKPLLAQAEAEAEASTEGEEREGDARTAPPKMTLEEYLKAQGVKLRKGPDDLMPEWRKVTKGLKAAQVMKIMDEASPGILWPSDFKKHREVRGV